MVSAVISSLSFSPVALGSVTKPPIIDGILFTKASPTSVPETIAFVATLATFPMSVAESFKSGTLAIKLVVYEPTTLLAKVEVIAVVTSEPVTAADTTPLVTALVMAVVTCFSVNFKASAIAVTLSAPPATNVPISLALAPVPDVIAPEIALLTTSPPVIAANTDDDAEPNTAAPTVVAPAPVTPKLFPILAAVAAVPAAPVTKEPTPPEMTPNARPGNALSTKPKKPPCCLFRSATPS